MIMQEPGDSFLLLWAGTVCNATSRFLHRWYEEDTGREKKMTKTVLKCKKGKSKQEFRSLEVIIIQLGSSKNKSPLDHLLEQECNSRAMHQLTVYKNMDLAKL